MIIRSKADQDALVLKHWKLIPYYIAKLNLLNFPSALKDDLMQEGFIGLMRAARDYDPTRGSFSHYGVQWIRAYVGRFLGYEFARDNHKSKKRVPGGYSKPESSFSAAPRMQYMDDDLERLVDQDSDPETNAINNQRLKAFRSALNDACQSDIKLQQVVKCRMSSEREFTLQETANVVALSRASVQNMEKKILGRAKKILSDSLTDSASA